MKGTILIGALAVTLTLGLLVFIRESSRPAQPVRNNLLLPMCYPLKANRLVAR
jgi:hypothetical protein